MVKKSIQQKETLFQQAHHAQKSGNLEKAVKTYEELLISENSPGAWSNLGVAYRSLGLLDKALETLQKGISKHPGFLDLHYNLGNALRSANKPEKALQHYQRVLKENPAHKGTISNLILCFEECGRLEESLALSHKALAQFPDRPDIVNNAGVILRKKGYFQSAKTCFERASSLHPDFIPARYNLGQAYAVLGEPENAEKELKLTLKHNPENPNIKASLGQVCVNLGKLKQALTYAKQVLKKHPEHVDAHLCQARAWLIQGELKKGLKEYDWRWKLKPYQRLELETPLWRGEDLKGKTLFVHPEQGYGDMIQFVRYIPKLLEKGAKVILEAPDAVRPLFQYLICEGDLILIPYGSPAKPHDYHVPLLDIPLCCDSTLKTIPKTIPYFHFQRKPSTGKGPKKVGIVWCGNPVNKNDHNRSCTLEDFSPLLGVPNIRFYSFQAGGADKEINDLNLQGLLLDAGKSLKNFKHTAEHLLSMDLVVSVDTAIVHLAGALNIPVWTLLPFTPDWRWMLNRKDTPWYPSMTLLRQKDPGNWKELLNRTKDRLKSWAIEKP
ncbi:MAG: tetratricopeptide repeat protein [bacterium]|nr:tetratricopeptide repeat protein [bacterium]